MNDKEFRNTVAAELAEIGASKGVANVGDQFAIWFTSRILGEDEGDAAEAYCIGGAGDEKIDIGICDDDHELTVIGQCKYSPAPHDYSKDLVDETRNALHRAQTSPNTGSQKRREFCETFNKSEKPILLIAAGFGDVEPETVAYAVENAVVLYDYKRIKERFEFLTLPGGAIEPEKITLRLAGQGVSSLETKRVPELVQAEGGREEVNEKPRSFGHYSLLMFLANVDDVAKAVHVHKDALFQSNLRYRLLARSEGKIGKQIQDTVLHNGELLPALNNGLTIVCQEAIIARAGEVTLVRPQVVNGGQTAWAIHDACEDIRRIKPRFLEENQLAILIRAIRTSNSEFVQRVTEATNTQNPIDDRDLCADRIEQVAIQGAFDRFCIGGKDFPVLYEHKRGQFEVLQRSNQQGRYRIRGNLYRRLSNSLAGQMYLALLGLPHWSKNQKGKVFGDEHVYRTIFEVDLPSKVRFKNDEMGLDPKSVLLRSGSALIFVGDIAFAHAVNVVCRAYSEGYSERVKQWPIEEAGTNEYRILQAHRFVKLWNYYVIWAVNYIVERISGGKESERDGLRQALVGQAIDRYFSSDLGGFLNIRRGTDSHLVLDQENPSNEVPVLAAWLVSLTSLMYDMVEKERAKPDWRSERHFFDLRSETVRDFSLKLDEILGGPRQKRDQWFPVKPPVAPEK